MGSLELLGGVKQGPMLFNGLKGETGSEQYFFVWESQPWVAQIRRYRVFYRLNNGLTPTFTNFQGQMKLVNQDLAEAIQRGQVRASSYAAKHLEQLKTWVR